MRIVCAHFFSLSFFWYWSTRISVWTVRTCERFYAIGLLFSNLNSRTVDAIIMCYLLRDVVHPQKYIYFSKAKRSHSRITAEKNRNVFYRSVSCCCCCWTSSVDDWHVPRDMWGLFFFAKNKIHCDCRLPFFASAIYIYVYLVCVTHSILGFYVENFPFQSRVTFAIIVFDLHYLYTSSFLLQELFTNKNKTPRKEHCEIASLPWS